MKVYVMEVSENGVVYSGRMDNLQMDDQSIREFLNGDYCTYPISKEFVVIAHQKNEQVMDVENIQIDGIQQQLHLHVNRAFVQGKKMERLFFGNLIVVRIKENHWDDIKDEDVNAIKKHLKPAFYAKGMVYIPDDT